MATSGIAYHAPSHVADEYGFSGAVGGRRGPRGRSQAAQIILVPEGTSMSALTVQVLRLSLSLGSVTAVNLRRSVCGAQGSLDR